MLRKQKLVGMQQLNFKGVRTLQTFTLKGSVSQSVPRAMKMMIAKHVEIQIACSLV